MHRFDIPLLKKELIEQSNRLRTYIVRTHYALFFFGLVIYSTLEVFQSLAADDAFAVLGYGRLIFDKLFLWQVVGMYIFLPAFASTTIVHEREMGTLDILMTTKLSPSAIILEKVLSSLVPMWTLLLISMPLAALAYSLGGITQYSLWTAVALLLVESARIAVSGVACSASSQTSIKAFGLSYFLALIGWFGIWVALSGPIAFGVALVGYLIFISVTFAFGYGGLLKLQEASKESARADIFYDSEEFVPKDVLEEKLQRWIVRKRDVPTVKPIEWRERSLRSQTRGNFLLRTGVWLILPLLIMICLLLDRGGSSAGSTIIFFFLASMVMYPSICIKACSVIQTERSHETLNLLLTLPITGRDLIHQKLFEVRKTINLFSVLLVTCVAFEAYWRWERADFSGTMEFLLAAIFALVVYPRLVMWLSLWLGTLIRQYVVAILLTLAVCAAVSFSPVIFAGDISYITSPPVFVRGFYSPRTQEPSWAITCHIILFTSAWLVLSQVYLRRVDRLMDRL